MQFTPRVGALWTLALVLERALSGLAVAAFPMAKNTGLAHTFATAADRTAVRNVLAVLAALLCGALLILGGGALAAVAIFLFFITAAPPFYSSFLQQRYPQSLSGSEAPY